MAWDVRILRRLRLRDLDTLAVVADCGSMAKAASCLSISQPAISKCIADMERTLGVRLLDRTSQGAEPTIYGRALLKAGTAMFDELRQGVIEIEHLLDAASGEVRIATSEPYAIGLMPILIDKVSARYPRISINVTATPVGSLHVHAPQYADLRDRRVDMIFGPIFDPVIEEDLQTETLFEEPIVVAAGSHNASVHKRNVALADLMGEPWCLQPPDTFAGALFAQAFKNSGLDIPTKHVMTSSVHLQIGMLATKRYFTMLPGSLMRFTGDRFAIKALPIRLPVAPRPAGIVTLRNRTISPVARVILEYARELLRPATHLSTKRKSATEPNSRRSGGK
jgi:DNA-binding transcriptional LysR family regulator